MKAAGNIILVIDEVHNIVGAGDAEGSMNAANILKPALSRGEIQVIGATTMTEYRKYIEKDSALERRFQPVLVDEPSFEDTEKILRGIKHYYEEYHGIKIPDSVLSYAVKLSERYITDRFLPDKAIDLIDEAASHISLSSPQINERAQLIDEKKALEAEHAELETKAADGSVTPIMETKDILLPGVHNIENYMAAFAAVRGLVSYETMRKIARTFGGVEHRIELIRTRNGVRWYNDSIASSPSRTIAGLNSFPEKVILIAGGKDKGISYAPLGPVVNDHVKLLLLCGKTAGVIREAVEQAENYRGLEIRDVADYHEAVAIADEASRPGDVVILSPASTSFDRFANFMERGQVFKAIVNELK